MGADSAYDAKQKAKAGGSPVVVPGSAGDPFYQSTGKMKEVTLPDGRKIQALDVGSTKPPPALEIGKVSAASGLTITGTERNAAKEAEARALGYTKEYLASRGGINSEGYFNDTPISGQLTSAERKQVTLPNGNIDTAGMARILQEKQIKELVSTGVSLADATAKVSGQYGEYGVPLVNDGMGSYDANGKPLVGGGYDSSGNPVSGGGSNPLSMAGTATNTGTTQELAIDVFRRTIGMFMGEAEMSKPWVDTLYKSVSKFYKGGATPDESINFALQDVRNNKDMIDFTNRFKGIYALQDAKVKGLAVTVPTIAEYFAAESKMGDILKASGLGELATEDFLGGVLGKGVSVTEFNNRVTNIFNKIDFAPEQVKSTIQRFYPYVDRISLAKALATGDKGAAQLAQDVAGYEVLAAAESQGLGSTQISQGLDLRTATDYARSGLDYQTALGKFSQVAQVMPVERKLAEISNRQSIGQVGVERAIINKSASDLTALQDLTKEEEARFQGSSGRFASKNRGLGQY